MIVIDGSEGEGGGQMVRNALALSLISGQPFRIFNIRAGRSKPGLMRQHLTALQAAIAIGDAVCDGARVGSSEFEFRPGRVRAGEHRFAVGTAGSTSLVLQTILAPLMLADGPSRLVLEGGTHNPSAPPFDFIAGAFLPLINRMGPKITARLVRHGFYPAGGGRIEVDIEPSSSLQGIELIERGRLIDVGARAIVASLDRAIAERELEKVSEGLEWAAEKLQVVFLPTEHGQGNILLLEARFENVTEIVSGFGQLGISAESVGKKAAGRMAGYLASTAAVGPYLADQLLLPLVLAGAGSFTTVKPSQHSVTAADVIARFVDQTVTFRQQSGGCYLASVA